MDPPHCRCATDHVCHFSSMFSHLIKIKPLVIKLPNGVSVKTFHSGTIHFNKHFYLDNVLYIPDFHTNLISIPRIATTLDCTIYFDSSKCLIHGDNTLKMIGTTELFNGLYMLTPSYLSFQTITICTNLLFAVIT